MFPVEFWATVLEAASEALGDDVSIQAKGDQEDRDGAKAMSDYSSSLWFTGLSLSPDSFLDSFWQVRDFVFFVFSLLTRGTFRRRFIACGFPIGGQQRAIWIWLVVVLLFLLEQHVLCPPRRRWSGAGWRR